MVNLGPTETYHPKPGDIGITRISGSGGLAIRFGQWLNGDGFKDREHAFGVEHVDPDGTVWIVEAMPGGARHVKNWHKDSETDYLRCPDQYRDVVAAAFLGYVHVPYAWLDYDLLALHRFHIPAPHLKKFIASHKSMICSQLVDQAAADGGWHLFSDGRWSGDITPGDLEKLYSKQRDGLK